MFRLPSPGAYRLDLPPLAQAMCQIRYPLVAPISKLDRISAFQDAVRSFLPYLEAVQQHELAVLIGPAGPAMPPGAATTSAWKFTNDSGWVLSLDPGSVTLGVGAEYTSADDFADRLGVVTRALADTLMIPRCDRLGVRYVDLVQLDMATDDWTWAEWFRPELRGWLGDEILDEEAVLAVHLTQSQLSHPATGPFAGWPDPVQAIIRHGLVPAGTGVPLMPLAPPMQLTHPHFLVDQDLFVEGPQPFDPTKLVERFRVLHAQIDAFFRWALTPAGERHFRVTAV